MSFRYEDKRWTGITTDFSAYGAFINTTIYPKVGDELVLTYTLSLPKRQHIQFYTRVHRVVDPTIRESVPPGIAVSWTEIRSNMKPAALDKILSDLAETPIQSRALGTGSCWSPQDAEAEMASLRNADKDRLRQELSALNQKLPCIPKRLKTETEDRRETRRIDTKTPILYFANHMPCQGVVEDMSLRGLFIATTVAPPAVGSTVVCRYPLPATRNGVRIIGVVTRVRVEGTRGFGIQILRMFDEAAAKRFARYVDTMKS
jgi:hypothetical protein